MLPEERITFLREHNVCSGIGSFLRKSFFIKESEAVSQLTKTQRNLCPETKKGLSCYSLCGIIYHIIFVFDDN